MPILMLWMIWKIAVRRRDKRTFNGQNREQHARVGRHVMFEQVMLLCPDHT